MLLYLESFGNPRRFARIARRVAASKPIVAVKSGRSPAGARATSSHTGALLSASDVTVDALFQQAGVIRTDTMHELFDVAALLSAQPVPRGRARGDRDQCRRARDHVRRRLPGGRARGGRAARAGCARRSPASCPREASLSNPIDMIATAPAPRPTARAIEVLAEEDACDAIIAIFVPPLVTRRAAVARAIRAAAAKAGAVSDCGRVHDEREARRPSWPARGTRVPAFDFPEDAAVALARAARYGRWRARPAGCRARP